MYHTITTALLVFETKLAAVHVPELNRLTVPMTVAEVLTAKISESRRISLPQIAKATITKPSPSLELLVIVDYVNELVHEQGRLIVFPVVWAITPSSRAH